MVIQSITKSFPDSLCPSFKTWRVKCGFAVETAQGWGQNKVESLAGDLEKRLFGSRLSLTAGR